MDIVDAAKRSRMMAAVGGRNTRPELQVRRALHRRGLRFRLHAKDLPGSPDIVLRRWGVVILVQGCFWHRHEGCRLTTMPGTRREFWERKFAANVDRDTRNLEALRTAGWRVAILWECGLRSAQVEGLIEKLEIWIRGGQGLFLELPGTAGADGSRREKKYD